LEQKDNIVYKMSERMQSTILRHYIYIKDQKNQSNRRNGQEILGNRQGTGSNKSRRLTEIYSTIYLSI